MEIPQNRATSFLTRPLVLLLVGAGVLALIVLDIFLAVDDIGGNTWSELVRSAGEFTPAVPWLLGLVMGHWFHPSEEATPRIEPPGNALALLALTLVWVLIGLVVKIPTWVPVPIGGVAGWLLWPVEASAAGEGAGEGGEG